MLGSRGEREGLTVKAIMSWALVVLGHIRRWENDSFLILQIIIKLRVAFDRLIHKKLLVTFDRLIHKKLVVRL